MSDYYNLEKTAEILKLTPAEINRLREQGEIQGFRDGSNWKFKKEVIDNYYVTMTQKKKPGTGAFGLDSEENDLLTSGDEQELPTMMADSASFEQFGDGLMSLQDDKMDAAFDANFGDGLSLPDDDGIQLDDLSLSLDKPAKSKQEKIEIFAIAGENGTSDLTIDSDSGLNLGGDSGISLVGGSGSGVDLAGSDRIFDDDDIVLGSSSSGLNLGGESGISLLDAAAESGFSLGAAAGGSDAILELAPEDDILALIDEDVDPDTATMLGAEDDFQLQADDDLFSSDDSESSSQVIAIEDDLASDLNDFSFAGDSAAAVSDDDSLFTSDLSAGSDMSEMPSFAEVGDSPFGGFDSAGFDSAGFDSADDVSGGFGSAADAGAATAPTSTKPGIQEAKFTGLSVTALFIMVLIMAVGGSLMYELTRCMWSWSEPFAINSSILGLFGK